MGRRKTMRKSGYYDKNGQEYQTGQRVKLNLPQEEKP